MGMGIMGICLSVREESTTGSVVVVPNFIKLCLRHPRRLWTPRRRIPITKLKHSSRTIETYLAFLISILLTSHVVAAAINHHHHHSNSNNNNRNNKTNASPNSVRQTRNAGQANHGSAMIMRPEFFIVPIGGVIHLFPRYGYLSLSMKVIAKNGTGTVQNDTWMFLEPVNNVIEPATLKVEETKFSLVNNGDSLPFHNLFHFDMCEDIRALMEAYFKNFSIEGLDKPWQAWIGGWRSATIARNFGIDQQFVDGDYRFVLVKVLLVRGSGSVEDIENSNVSQAYVSNFQRFLPDNELSTYEFFKVVGTHYIHSYIMGNAIYQVFVYDPDGFQAVKRRLFFDGIKNERGSAEPILESLTTWMKHVGQVGVLNAEPDVIESVRKALVMPNSVSQPAPNILKMHDNADLVKLIETLLASQPNGILGLDLRGIHFLFKDPVQRAGFITALKHKMQLWEVNFLY